MDQTAPAWRLYADVKDIAYEEDVLRNPMNYKSWLYYLEYKIDAPRKARYLIYERALKALPGSYKLWFKYLTERRVFCRGKRPTDPLITDTNNAFERSLVFMHKMPRIWVEYLEFLSTQFHITSTRHVFDRALQSLPVTQHVKMWPVYLNFVKQCGVPETAVRVYRRYLKIEPDKVEEFIKYLKDIDRLDDAAVKLAECVNDDNFASQDGRSKNDLWSDLLSIITKNPDKISSLDVEAIIRAGLKRFTHEIGHLWVALADYYVRKGHFEKARDIYEEGLSTVTTVRDFTMIFDAYSQYEENMIAAQMTQQQEEPTGNAESDSEEEKGEDAEFNTDLDLRVARLEDLLTRRPLMLSSVLLRQNPHNVQEWHNRVKLMAGDAEKTVLTYSEAVTTVDPMLATGKPHTLWTAFARYYEDNDETLDNAREVFMRATKVNFKHLDDLATVWCQWAEMELRHNNSKEALMVLKKACVAPAKRINQFRHKDVENDIPTTKRLYRSTKLWSFYADLEENFGTLGSCKAVYEAMIDLKIVTPQIVLNYAALLEERKFFEESFQAYEKGVALFNYPHVFPIWAAYLTKFIARYKGTKVERTRDLFQDALKKAPPHEAKKLFLLFAKFEEDHGLARRAMQVYDDACKVVAPTDRFEMYSIYITRVAEFWGLTKTREIYEKAITSIPESSLRDMCLKYASMERKLGEIDRARAIYSYASQFCNPKVDNVFWKTWHDFEVQHGNKETFKDMLRIRRSVTAQFATSNVVEAAMALAGGPTFKKGSTVLPGTVDNRPTAEGAAAQLLASAARKRPAANTIEALEAQAAAEEQSEEQAIAAAAAAAAPPPPAAAIPASNPEEIDLDGDTGSASAPSVSTAAEEPLGALARLRKHKG